MPSLALPEAEQDLCGASYGASTPRGALRYRLEWPRARLVLPMYQRVEGCCREGRRVERRRGRRGRGRASAATRVAWGELWYGYFAPMRDLLGGGDILCRCGGQIDDESRERERDLRYEGWHASWWKSLNELAALYSRLVFTVPPAEGGIHDMYFDEQSGLESIACPVILLRLSASSTCTDREVAPLAPISGLPTMNGIQGCMAPISSSPLTFVGASPCALCADIAWGPWRG